MNSFNINYYILIIFVQITNFGLPDNTTSLCKSISGSIFYSNTTTLSITINDSVILPYSDYMINVRPLNGYGWGNITNKSIKTNQYCKLILLFSFYLKKHNIFDLFHLNYLKFSFYQIEHNYYGFLQRKFETFRRQISLR